MKTRRLTPILVLTLLLLSAFPVNASSKDPVSITIEKVEIQPNDTASVSLYINGEYNATALTLFVDFDPSVISLEGSILHGEVWIEIQNAGGMIQVSTNNPGQIGFMAIVFSGDFSSSGTLFTMNFTLASEVPPETSIPIQLTVQQFTFDELSGNVINIPFVATDGAIIVLGTSLVMVSFIDGIDGTIILTVYVDPGSTVEPPDPPQHQWYLFDHWEGDMENVTDDTIITAVYKMLGDVNGNESIDMSDALLTLRYSMRLIPELDELIADIDQNGTVNITDALIMLRRAMGLI